MTSKNGAHLGLLCACVSIMKQVKLFCVSALMFISTAAIGQTFTHDGILYQVQPDGKAKVVNVYNYENITIPDTVCCGNSSFAVSEIGRNAFYCLYNLRVVTLPNTLCHICDDAFVYCISLRKIVLMAKEPPLCDGAIFRMINLSKVSLAVPNGCKEAYMKTSPWNETSEIIESAPSKGNAKKLRLTNK